MAPPKTLPLTQEVFFYFIQTNHAETQRSQRSHKDTKIFFEVQKCLL